MIQAVFLPNYVNVRKLRDGAVPSLFNFPDQLVKKTKKGRSTLKKRKIKEIADDDDETVTPEASLIDRANQKGRESLALQAQDSPCAPNSLEPEPVLVAEHTYAMSTSPFEVAAKLNSIILRNQETVKYYKQKCRNYKRKCERKDKKISSLKALLSELRSKMRTNNKTATRFTADQTEAYEFVLESFKCR